MNSYWKQFWKDRYKNKSFNRALKSTSKIEKYKYFAYPNNNFGAGPLGMPGMLPFNGTAPLMGGGMMLDPMTGLPQPYNSNYPH